MAVTYGFYSSVNGDRRYDAEQVSSLFDGLITDGVYMAIGGRFFVSAGGGMQINVATGRAWFDHTWTLNDNTIPIAIEPSSSVLNRWDAVVLTVNSNISTRANKIEYITGSPASSPSKPALVNTSTKHQHPLAYIYVGAGVSSISQANIQNMVGTSACPFVTGVVQNMNIDNLIAQWQGQWNAWLSGKPAEFEAWRLAFQASMESWQASFENGMANWKGAIVRDTEAFKQDYETTFTTWYNATIADIEEQIDFMIRDFDRRNREKSRQLQDQWNSWFIGYINNHQQDVEEFIRNNQEDFDEWFSSVQVSLEPEVATRLANEIADLQRRTTYLENNYFAVPTDHIFLYDLYDLTYTEEVPVNDNESGTAEDNEDDDIVALRERSEKVLDNEGNVIQASIIYEQKHQYACPCNQ